MKNKISLIDISVNLSDKRFSDDIESVLERAQQTGIDKIVITGTSEAASRTALELIKQYDTQFPELLYTTVGVHPHYSDSFNSDSVDHLKEFAKQPRVVAIGETGLDFNRNFSSQKHQINAFEQQLELAAKLQKPLFMHERDAAKQQLEILQTYRDHFTQGVIHCFTGDHKTLFNYLDLDLHIGITGWICDERRGLELQKLVKNIPLNRLMIETDAPYLLPRTLKAPPNNRRNEPCYLPWILEMISDCRDESQEILASAIRKTTCAFFAI